MKTLTLALSANGKNWEDVFLVRVSRGEWKEIYRSFRMVHKSDTFHAAIFENTHEGGLAVIEVFDRLVNDQDIVPTILPVIQSARIVFESHPK